MHSTQNKKRLRATVAAILLILIAAIAMPFLDPASNAPISKTACFLDIFVHALTLIFAVKIYKKMDTPDKKKFRWFILSIISLYLCDTFFYILIYAYNIPMEDLRYLFISLPFCIWLFISLYFFSTLILNSGMAKTIWRGLFCLFLMINALFVYLFTQSSDWQLAFLSLQGSYSVITWLFTLTLFDWLILCLMCAEESAIQFFLSGVIVQIAGEFLLRYSVISKKINVLAFGELFWLAGLISICIGLILIDANRSYDLSQWLRKNGAIKTRIIFWTFGVSMISFLGFCIFAYSFSIISGVIFSGVPFFTILYSVFFVLISIYIGRRFEAPFKTLAANIELFAANPGKTPKYANHKIQEFIFLQKFILNAFVANEERDKAKKMLGDAAEQVAHDIRTPAATLSIYLKNCLGLSEEDRLTLRGAAERIEDIANNLITAYPTNDDNSLPAITQPVILSVAILSVLSEKRIQFRDTDISFLSQITHEAYFAFVMINPIELKRMLSNLINNAVESCHSKRVIKLECACTATTVSLDIIDSGKGFSPEQLDKIRQKQFASVGKSDGTGLGIPHAIQTIEGYAGSFEISNNQEAGATVKLTLPRMHAPPWFLDRIDLYHHDILVIADDDKAIHTAWMQKFNAAEGAIQIKHFENSTECIEFINAQVDKRKILLLTDYEFINQADNGLNIIEKTQVPRAILVTSHHANAELLKRAQALNAKVLPKILTPEVSFKVLEAKMEEHLHSPRTVDFILVDDSEQFAINVKMVARIKGKTVDIYHDTYSLLEVLNAYPQSTRILLDYDLGFGLTGIEFAQALFNKGYTNLYLVSGYAFSPKELPPYLKCIGKKGVFDFE